MVGFPGETDEEFNQSLEFVKLINFSKIHVFKYSQRAGTQQINILIKLIPNKRREK
jgi:threonylcarbamoyladenosine tRNA methylthiotransferase MtaB